MQCGSSSNDDDDDGMMVTLTSPPTPDEDGRKVAVCRNRFGRRRGCAVDVGCSRQRRTNEVAEAVDIAAVDDDVALLLGATPGGNGGVGGSSNPRWGEHSTS